MSVVNKRRETDGASQTRRLKSNNIITIHFTKHCKYKQEHRRLTDVGESEFQKRIGHSKFTTMATWGG